MNQVILNRYVETLQNKLREAQLEVEVQNRQALQQNREQTQAIQAALSGQLEESFLKVGQLWEERFRAVSELELARIRRAALYSQIGGFLVLLAGGLAFGMFIGQFIFH